MEKPEEAFWEDLCFEVQQAAEKAIKTVFQHKGLSFRYVHDLEKLLVELKNQGIEIPDDIKEAAKLTQYAIETRYPGLGEEVTEEEYLPALAIAERVVTRADAIIHETNSASA